jgi:LuxR family maltose regulon positive regulatory protein
VLQLVGAGLSNRAIAERSIISVATVKKHIENIHGKLDVRSRTQALARSGAGAAVAWLIISM